MFSLPAAAVTIHDGGGLAVGNPATAAQVTFNSLAIQQAPGPAKHDRAAFKLAGTGTSDQITTAGTFAASGTTVVNLSDFGLALNGSGRGELSAGRRPGHDQRRFVELHPARWAFATVGDYNASLGLSGGVLSATLAYNPNQWALATGGTWGTASNWARLLLRASPPASCPAT